ncbi:MAG: DegV family protein [Atopobiaceae bacterium]|jgi:DegV family protein with EDD domain|nr:DegV family EDD domain-containing protein [Atopobiaceae bacterium]MCH4179974.1 DegV family EDD domain-containing protein [Atopobiaceae bacterium]MCH4213725.1 DegV family EDD domain-containing protein [Atopobiaceae bacterium]MCH4230070.1 DegV family EDD domain-containing protein [Atopobiaceae bacterium]MCH4275918.1 DegV family EDD domain-containing protein [Atopobiaceae bacterium]
MLRIVTDSTSGLSREEAARLGVTVVPMGYLVDGVRYLEGFTGENGDYEQVFRSARVVTTEAVYPSAFADVFRTAVRAGYDVLAITISGRLSGTFRSASAAASEVNAEMGTAAATVAMPRVIAFDSWSTAGGLEAVVRAAVALASDGLSLTSVVGALTHVREQQRIYFSVPDLAVLRRSGRLGAMRRSVGTWLDRYPVMGLFEGGIRDVCVARGAAGMGRAMVRQAPVGAHDFILTHYGSRSEEARQTFYAVRRRFPDATVRVKDGGPVLSKNLGLGSVSLTWSSDGPAPGRGRADIMAASAGDGSMHDIDDDAHACEMRAGQGGNLQWIYLS